jgi:hypothetical protein
MIKKFLLIISILAMIGLYFEFYHNNTKVDDIGYEYIVG